MTDSDTVEGTAVDAPPAGGITSDVVYSLLADKRRRYTVHYLKQRGGSVSVGELAEQVAAWEYGKPIDEITSQERKRVYIALYQSHLPTLHKEGVVEYDDDRRVVELSPSMAGHEVYLEVVPKGSLPWSLFYVGLALANAVVLVLAWLDVSPFDSVPDIGWAAVILVTFAASAVVQTYQARRMRFGDEGPPPEIE